MSKDAALLIAAVTAVTVAVKAAGPIAFGGRPLPEPIAAVVDLLAPPLLAALVVTQALANGDKLAFGADTAGVGVAGVIAAAGGSAMACVLSATGVAALGRLIT